MLVVDVGNSRASFGLFQKDNLRSIFHIAASDFLDQNKVNEGLAESIKDKLCYHSADGHYPERLVIASVNQRLSTKLGDLLSGAFQIKAESLSWNHKKNIHLQVQNPQTLGIDRIANAAAVRAIYKVPAIIIDLGTAVTVDYLDAEANFTGGVIFPGPSTAMNSFRSVLPHLPEISLTRPEQVIGRHTLEAMQSGLFYGWLSMLEGFVERFKANGAAQNAHVVITGGFSSYFADQFKYPVIHDENLTLHGIHVLATC